MLSYAYLFSLRTCFEPLRNTGKLNELKRYTLILRESLQMH